MKKIILSLSLLLIANFIFAQWTTSGTNINNTNTGNVGIGTTSPDALLNVNGTAHLGRDLNLTRPDGSGASIVVDNVLSTSIYMQKVGGGNIALINMLASLVGISGNLGIGTLDTKGYQLAVNGSAVFTKAVVKLQGNWPDYIFRKDYTLPSLKSVEEYIKTNNHLPGMPTSDSVQKNGLDLGTNQAKLLEKIEELTLYTIQLQKQVEKLETENQKITNLQQQISGNKSQAANLQ